MAIVVFRRRDGLARECSLRITSGDLRTPVLLPTDGALVSPRPDARMLSHASPAEAGAALTDVPSFRFTAHSPAAIARPLAQRNADLLAAADGPTSLGHLHLTQHNDLLDLQLNALYDSGVPVAWIRNPDELTGADLIRKLMVVKESLPDVILIASTKRFELIPFCGHFWQEERPSEFASHMRQFLTEHLVTRVRAAERAAAKEADAAVIRATAAGPSGGDNGGTTVKAKPKAKPKTKAKRRPKKAPPAARAGR